MFQTHESERPRADDSPDGGRRVEHMVVMAAAAVAMAPTIYADHRSISMVLPVAFPWALLVVAARRRWAGDGLSVRDTVVLAGAPIAPSVLLALLAFMQAPVHAGTAVIAVRAAVVGGALAFACFVILPRTRAPGLGALVLALGVCYGYGGAVTANSLFDGSDGRVVEAAVVDRWVTHPVRRGRSSTSRDPNPRYMVQVEAFGATAVDEEAYSYSKIGQPTCVQLRDGVLGIPWFTIRRCAPAGPR
jgi:hypothetical protein